ncbi:uncharacterized protein LOC130790290 [Actinidia eriantha]|uniref:uncharacterized protein LOC130790290 n=1 Tax=Actinidia eriantha TaxID=165200 RepID=UPI00258BA06A|nr:uncharacterized protein LOC130790290 [Actinidia eriantha]XP_057507265.1 uncharacterized protein LOC130790290 [Actinidia eriantha]
MEPNKEEALRAIRYAEKRFVEKDFTGARNYALKAQMLFPELEGISQMVATFDVYIASAMKINGETDFYSILGLDPSANKPRLKKQYKKMAVLLHPDKNKTVGADGAFKLVSEAWTLLSDSKMRNSYDLRRNRQVSSGSSVSHGLDTFWTLCTSCQVQYEYLRKYLNKKLSCKNCRGVFIAVETGAGPVNGSFPYCPPSYVPDNGYGNHAYNGVTYGPTTAVYFAGNGVSGFHPGHGSEYVSNVSFQWGSFPGASAGAVDPNGLNVKSASVVHQANGNGGRPRSNGKHEIKNNAADMCSNVITGYNEPLVGRVRGPYKKRKLDMGGASRNGSEELASRTTSEVTIVNGNESTNSKLSATSNTQTRRYSAAPAFDARKLLMDKARAEIHKNLEELRLASAATGEKIMKASDEVGKAEETFKKTDLAISVRQPELKKTGSTSITVPDSDFHDFDKDRSEDCFKPKQIWALYDEEDGMPRLYCLIREIISVKPFKIHISYLNSKTDIEFGLVNWIDSGFTKSCGNFRAWNSDVVEQVNVFSHLLSKEKAGRGGCIKFYPRSGDIWAVYRNWSPEWNRNTPDEVRHQYEMVEVLDDYSEALGVCVAPLIKLDGFKTVYQRNMNKSSIRWIPRREMVRFSHMVPSWLLKEGANLPEGCWDLDPAATPDELLVAAPEAKTED